MRNAPSVFGKFYMEHLGSPTHTICETMPIQLLPHLFALIVARLMKWQG